MEIPRDSHALRLLRGEDAAAALPPLGLEPVEHAVERGDDASDLVVAGHRNPLAGSEEVDHLHPLCKAPNGVKARLSRTAFTAIVMSSPPTTTTLPPARSEC